MHYTNPGRLLLGGHRAETDSPLAHVAGMMKMLKIDAAIGTIEII